MLVVCIRMSPYVPYVTRMLLVCYPYVLMWCFSHDHHLPVRAAKVSKFHCIDPREPLFYHSLWLNRFVGTRNPFVLTTVPAYA